MAVHWVFGLVAMLFYGVVIAAVVLVVVAAIRVLSRPGGPMPATGPTPPAESPLDILARRFASGEISAEEYQKARDLLKQG